MLYENRELVFVTTTSIVIEARNDIIFRHASVVVQGSSVQELGGSPVGFADSQMPCSICGEPGHNATSCKKALAKAAAADSAKKTGGSSGLTRSGSAAGLTAVSEAPKVLSHREACQLIRKQGCEKKHKSMRRGVTIASTSVYYYYHCYYHYHYYAHCYYYRYATTISNT